MKAHPILPVTSPQGSGDVGTCADFITRMTIVDSWGNILNIDASHRDFKVRACSANERVFAMVLKAGERVRDADSVLRCPDTVIAAHDGPIPTLYPFHLNCPNKKGLYRLPRDVWHRARRHRQGTRRSLHVHHLHASTVIPSIIDGAD